MPVEETNLKVTDIFCISLILYIHINSLSTFMIGDLKYTILILTIYL